MSEHRMRRTTAAVKKHNGGLLKQVKEVGAANAKLRAENEKLRAENEKLRAEKDQA